MNTYMWCAAAEANESRSRRRSESDKVDQIVNTRWSGKQIMEDDPHRSRGRRPAPPML